MLEKAIILPKFGEKLIRKAWSIKVLNNMDGMKSIRWNECMKYFQL